VNVIDLMIPFTLSDLNLWLAVIAIILLITSELLNVSQEYSSRIPVSKTRMRIVAIGFGIAFIVTLVLRFR
jgi:hypothetical protein